MSNTSSGAVTFFFSDIQGSTRLLEALGADFATVLERHRRVLRAEFAARGAIEVSTEGDSFFAVFADARGAIEATVAIQRQLADETWPDGASLRVRIGLHTGEATAQDGDYVGLEVHRASRIMSAAHGGQVVISDATRRAAGILPPGIDVRDLGTHRLRDLSSRERLFQVLADGLETTFPPVRTVDAIPNNLPTQPTELVGRAAELAAIREALDAPTLRLVTLTGPGGVGKTRLAIQAAADRIHVFEDGAFFVDLAHARDEGAMVDAIVRAVVINVAADADPRDALLDHLQSRAILLVLDNFEQLIDAADAVAEILARSPRTKALVTSREALRLRGERNIPIAPLSLPGPSTKLDAETALRADSVRLFVQRAWEASPDFSLSDADAPDVAQICATLDGLPLAIELAAASLRLFSPRELRAQLQTQLEAIPGGPRDLPARQRTLRSTIEWSYELLDARERQLLAVMSLFGSASVSAVREVAARIPALNGVDVLGTVTALLDKSLLRREPSGDEQRLTMLETIRRYAAERLAETPELAEVAARAHAAHYADVATKAHGPRHGAGASTTLDRLTAELGNLQAAWAYWLERGDFGELNKLVGALWLVHEGRGWYHSAVALANDLLGVLARSSPSPERADEEVTLRLVLARGLLALRGYTPEVERLYQEALQVSESKQSAPKRLAVLRSLGSFYLYRAQVDRTAAVGRQLLDLAEETQDRSLELEGHMLLGPATAFLGDARAGLDHLERAMALFDPERHQSPPFRLGPSPGVAAPLVAALFHWWLGEPDTARRLATSALELAERMEHPYTLAYAHFHAGVLDIWNGDYVMARKRADRVRAVADEHDYTIWKAVGLVLGGVAEAASGDAQVGREWAETGVGMYEGIQTPPVFWPVLLSLKAAAVARAGQLTEAIAVLDQALGLAGTDNWLSASFVVQKGEALLQAGRRDEAREALQRAAREAAMLGSRMVGLRALTLLASLTAGSEKAGVVKRLGALIAGFEEGLDSGQVTAAKSLLGSASVPAS